MRVKKVNHNKKDGIMIFITPMESDDAEVKKQIDDYRGLYKEVAVIVSGTNSIESTLEKILREKMSK